MIAIIIPTLDPDQSLVELAKKLQASGAELLLIVDDGSDTACELLFQQLHQLPGCRILRHAVNLGKGRALKTAFNDLLVNHPDCTGAVTADADGQHAVADIMRVTSELRNHPESLILGVRDFDAPVVPWKSRFGNRWSRRMFRVMVGLDIRDTQTGLRAIPASFMRTLLRSPGDRFDFESTMLIKAGTEHRDIRQTTIGTIYRDNNRASHFHPLRDSWQIGKVLFGQTVATLLLFCGSALVSAGIDLGCFALCIKYLIPEQLAVSIVGARIVSSMCNYLINRNVVFSIGQEQEGFGDSKSLVQYYSLCALVLAGSYLFTKLAVLCHVPLDVVVIKALVDLMLFLLSFLIQKHVIFRRNVPWEDF